MPASAVSRMMEPTTSSAITTTTTAAAVAPLYITVGPPCSGKTTWLRQQQPVMIQDVSLDDQEGVYVAVETALFLTNDSLIPPPPQTRGAATIMHTTNASRRIYFGQSIHERIASKEQAELRAVLQRLAGITTADQLAQQLTTATTAASSTAVTPALIQAVESYLQQHGTNNTGTTALVLPPTTDLFVRQSLFMTGGSTKNTVSHPSGIQRALAALHAVPTQQPVAWGNTNTRPTDYRDALSMAQSQGRPVRFVVYHCQRNTPATPADTSNANNTNSNCNSNCNTTSATLPTADDEDGCYDLVVSDWTELLRRSVQRLVQTGRYVPAAVIWDMHGRSLTMVQRVLDSCRVTNNSISKNDTSPAAMSKLQLDQGLARQVGFEMDLQRRVVRTQTRQTRAHGGHPTNRQRSTAPPMKRDRPSDASSTTERSTHQRPRLQQGGGGRRPWDQPHHHRGSNNNNNNSRGIPPPPRAGSSNRNAPPGDNNRDNGLERGHGPCDQGSWHAGPRPEPHSSSSRSQYSRSSDRGSLQQQNRTNNPNKGPWRPPNNRPGP